MALTSQSISISLTANLGNEKGLFCHHSSADGLRVKQFFQMACLDLCVCVCVYGDVIQVSVDLFSHQNNANNGLCVQCDALQGSFKSPLTLSDFISLLINGSII